ncbi:hypothetical protein Zmor_017514 [Zophobas morio]|uniref:Uncharacterized protein n=1 Tax=Zophobas morio TaxID=2755281 RepID=A0AA38IBJ6_9CUCU|nr:hypothetical protein Zmor_017514 [Zophobas morio]
MGPRGAPCGNPPVRWAFSRERIEWPPPLRNERVTGGGGGAGWGRRGPGSGAYLLQVHLPGGIRRTHTHTRTYRPTCGRRELHAFKTSTERRRR